MLHIQNVWDGFKGVINGEFCFGPYLPPHTHLFIMIFLIRLSISAVLLKADTLDEETPLYLCYFEFQKFNCELSVGKMFLFLTLE